MTFIAGFRSNRLQGRRKGTEPEEEKEKGRPTHFDFQSSLSLSSPIILSVCVSFPVMCKRQSVACGVIIGELVK